jgi:hypothetical protein
MTRAQRRDFELIATNQRPLGGHMTISALLRRGLIEEIPNASGPVMCKLFSVPLCHHMQWCEWASEQEVNHAMHKP